MATVVRPERADQITITDLRTAYSMAPDPNARAAVRTAFDVRGTAWCKFIYTYNTVVEMHDVIILVHAPLNCTSCMRTYKVSLYYNWGNPFMHSPTTDMKKSQVIFGSEEELLKAILAVDRDYKPKLIVILTGCAPGMTLDDVSRVMEQAQSRTTARLWHIPSAGFDYKNNGYFEDVLPLFAELMEPQPVVHKDWVNILGNNKEPYCRAREGRPAYHKGHNFVNDSEEMGRLIEAMGLKVHCVIAGDSYDEIRTAPGSAVNTITCASYGIPLAKAMEEKFGTPFVPLAQPLGPVSTSAWLRMLGQLTEHQEEAERVIKEEYEAIRPIWETCQEMVRGKTALIAGQANRPFSIGRMCQELGMKVVQVGHPMQLKFKGMDVEHWLSTGYNPGYAITDSRRLAGADMKELMDTLGLGDDEAVYMYCDFPAYARAGSFDAANVARADTSVHLRRSANWPSRGGGLGFRGAAGTCLMMMEAIKAARRKTSPTLQGRLYGKALDA